MPRSVFLGRIVEPGEPLWTDEDRTFALALLAVEADECSGCGHSLTETTAAASEGKYTAERIRCHACARAEQNATEFAQADGDMRGLRIHVTRD